MRRTRYTDVRSAGRSRFIPYLKGETAAQRHERRKQENLAQEGLLRQDMEKLGLTLKVTNMGHHWKMTRIGLIVEWWPSTAKLVFNKEYHEGIHCHDRFQVVSLIRSHLQATEIREVEEQRTSIAAPPPDTETGESDDCPF